MAKGEKSAGEGPTSRGSTPSSRLDRISSLVGKLAGGIAGVSILALLFINITNIALRETTGRGIGGAVELTEVVMAGIVYMAMAPAEISGTHVRTPILTNRLPSRAANSTRSVSMAIATMFIALTTVHTFEKAIMSQAAGEHRFALMSIPVWPARFAVAVGLALFAVVLAVGTYRAAQRTIRGKSFLERDYEGMP